ncbi:hypothetical protein AVEN_135076-1 [Araneus ventricosus]|uniref:Uncharacterized protein n=1 Tax=Araneus ventricosus TaxID=182803 RepID=A0A4Y2BF78_ARAVE|nr:hypothetical protein AVEN_135076-1 [Araneus ventricosus]
MSRQAARTTGGSHRYVPSGGPHHRWLAPICPIRRCLPSVTRTDMSHRRCSSPVVITDISHRRCSSSVAHTNISRQAARTTGGSHRYVPSGGPHHRWLAPICPIRRCSPSVTRTDMSHRRCSSPVAGTIVPSGGSHRSVAPCPSGAGALANGELMICPVGGARHRWLALICPVRRFSPHRCSHCPIRQLLTIDDNMICPIGGAITGGWHRYVP